jgi:hypothetical protein
MKEHPPSEAAVRPGDEIYIQRASLPVFTSLALAMISFPVLAAPLNGVGINLMLALTWTACCGAMMSMVARQYLFGVDRNGVFLQIDQRGVYFGGLGTQYPWWRIAKVVVFSHPRDDGIYRCGHVGLVLKEDPVGIRITGDPFRQGPTQTMMLMSAGRFDREKERVLQTVRWHAVAVEILDLGELKSIVWCRRRLKVSRRVEPRYGPNGKNSRWWSRRAPTEL